MLYIDGRQEPVWVDELYIEFNKLNPVDTVTEWNWKGGMVGQFLSQIYLELRNGQRFLIGTRNHESNVKCNDTEQYIHDIKSDSYIPCGIEVEDLHRFDLDKSLLDNLYSWFGDYDSSGNRVLSSYGYDLYVWLRPHYEGDVNISRFSTRFKNFSSYILFRHPDKYKDFRKSYLSEYNTSDEKLDDELLENGIPYAFDEYEYKFDTVDETWEHIQTLLKHCTQIDGSGSKVEEYVTKIVNSFMKRIINVEYFEVTCDETNNPPSAIDENDLRIEVKWKVNSHKLEYYINKVSRNE